MKMVRIVIALTPYDMALMTTIFSSYHFEQFASAYLVLSAPVTSRFFMMFIVHAILLILSGNNPARYFRMVWPVFLRCFPRSSAASIPLAISARGKFGVRKAPLPIFPPRLAPVWAKWLRRDLSGYYSTLDDCATIGIDRSRCISGRDVACHCARVYWRSRRRRRWYVRGADCPVDIEFSRCAGRYFYLPLNLSLIWCGTER